MTQDLISTVPGIYSAMLGLVQEAAEPLGDVEVVPFELGQCEPGQYITVHEIIGPAYAWESIGTFTQKESYEIAGCVTIFVGDFRTNDETVETDVLQQTLGLFQTCVMTPVMTNRTMPLLGTTGPSPHLMLPSRMKYSAGPGDVAGGPGGWVGKYAWSFSFEAFITPA